jgi:hypothetical protein
MAKTYYGQRIFATAASALRQTQCRQPSPAGATTDRTISGAFLFRFSKAYAGATAILVDELDARFLKCLSYDLKGRAARFTRPGF